MLLIGFNVAVKITPIPFVFSTQVILFSFIQRNLGMIALNLIFIQIILVAFAKPLTRIFGAWIYKFHVIEGVLAYMLAFLHPIFYLLTLKISGHGFDPYVAFVNACLLCKTPYDYYLTLGRISFWVLTIGIFVAIFRKSNNWLLKHWKNIHLLNYLVFILAVVHGFFIGSDFRSPVFLSIAIAEALVVLGIIIFVEFPRWWKDLRIWLSSENK